MSKSINTFSAEMTSMAEATGALTATNTATKTLAVPGLAVGFAAAVALAQDTTPHAGAATDGSVSGGYITSFHVNHLSIDFPHGPTPVSLDVSITSSSTYGNGDFLSGHSAYGLGSPSLHGLM